jgi:hypothetical protein
VLRICQASALPLEPHLPPHKSTNLKHTLLQWGYIINIIVMNTTFFHHLKKKPCTNHSPHSFLFPYAYLRQYHKNVIMCYSTYMEFSLYGHIIFDLFCHGLRHI